MCTDSPENFHGISCRNAIQIFTREIVSNLNLFYELRNSSNLCDLNKAIMTLKCMLLQFLKFHLQKIFENVKFERVMKKISGNFFKAQHQ